MGEPAQQIKKPNLINDTLKDVIRQLHEDKFYLYPHIELSIDNDKPAENISNYYFRFDTGDSTPKMNGYQLHDFQDDLSKYNLTILDPCIEHDCISGQIALIEMGESHG